MPHIRTYFFGYSLVQMHISSAPWVWGCIGFWDYWEGEFTSYGKACARRWRRTEGPVRFLEAMKLDGGRRTKCVCVWSVWATGNPVSKCHGRESAPNAKAKAMIREKGGLCEIIGSRTYHDSSICFFPRRINSIHCLLFHMRS